MIAGFSVDYEEQVLITGVKSNRSCPKCTVPPNDREHLRRTWSDRTHESTVAQIRLQEETVVAKSHDDYVHEEDNFAWDHALVNIHSCMLVDTLHQLLKGVSVHLLGWLEKIVRSPQDLDDRIRQVPAYQGLKIFPRGFIKLSQIAGVEQKSILRQLVPVVAPLLQDKPLAMLCTRAIVAFITIAQYPSQSDETLAKMQFHLAVIDVSKEAFRGVRKPGHFNFAKWHSLTHIPDLFRRYGSSRGTSTCQFEAQHRHLVKRFFGRTNMRESATVQLLEHNTRHTKTMVVQDEARAEELISMPSISPPDEIVATLTEPMKLSKLGWPQLQSGHHYQALLDHGLNPATFLPLSVVVAHLKVPQLFDAVKSIVIASRSKASRSNGIDKMDLTNDDGETSESKSWFVRVHSSVKCPPNEVKLDNSAGDKVVRAYCSPNWQKSGTWKRDHIWLREQRAMTGTAIRGRPEYLNGKVIGHIQLMMTVLDPDMLRERGKRVYYPCVFVKLLQPLWQGTVNDIHGMVELSELETFSFGGSISHSQYQAYAIDAVIRPAHVVPTGRPGRFYLNHYVDVDQYTEFDKASNQVDDMRMVEDIAQRWREQQETEG